MHGERSYGLLTDSILEVNWLAQERSNAAKKALIPKPPPLGSQSTRDVGVDDVAQSDPYAAYASFLRIAAPTAALGADTDVDVDSKLEDIEEGSNATNEGISDTSNVSMIEMARLRTKNAAVETPYGAGVLARRMLRFHLARRNREEFLEYFQGEFDNYAQVCTERRKNIYPGEGGGHEHIHCSLRTIPDDDNPNSESTAIEARYYFNGNPSIVFRRRVYRVFECENSDRGLLMMKIYRDDLPLEGCEVYWEKYTVPTNEPDNGARILGIDAGNSRFVGYMSGGGCNLYSNEIRERICVMDDLLLTRNDLWVADRAFDTDGNFVYGNRRGIPYKMKRVPENGELSWTVNGDEEPPHDYIP